MLNFYELMNVIEDQEARQIIQEAFISDFRKEYSKIHFNKSSRKQAFANFAKQYNVLADENHANLWACQYGIIYSNSMGFTDKAAEKTTDVFKICGEWIKGSNQIDVDQIELKSTIATARALGWSANKTLYNSYYSIDINDNHYDFNLVYNFAMMIADKDQTYGEGVQCFLVKMDGSARHVLGMRSKQGMAFVLPNISQGWSAYNVGFNNYMDFAKSEERRRIA